MDKLLKALKELNEEIEHILKLQVFEGLEILEAKEEPVKKKRLQKKGTLKKGETVVHFLAPDGNKVKIDFNSENPTLHIEASNFLEETGRV